MNIQLGKQLAQLLRHDPTYLDRNGWASVEEVLSVLGINFERLVEIVNNDNKNRFELEGNRIRARQGHSVKVDLGFSEVFEVPEMLFHGTIEKNISSILTKGLLPMKRQYVHLSLTEKTAIKTASRRKGRVVLITIDTKLAQELGSKFYLSSNNVWLANFIPVKALTGVISY